jgi:hypothetical protein
MATRQDPREATRERRAIADSLDAEVKYQRSRAEGLRRLNTPKKPKFDPIGDLARGATRLYKQVGEALDKAKGDR